MSCRHSLRRGSTRWSSVTHIHSVIRQCDCDAKSISIPHRRDTPLRYLVPFDASISLHRVLGVLLVIAALLHTGCHINNFIQQVIIPAGGQLKELQMVIEHIFSPKQLAPSW